MMLMLTRLWAMAWKNPDYVWAPPSAPPSC